MVISISFLNSGVALVNTQSGEKAMTAEKAYAIMAYAAKTQGILNETHPGDAAVVWFNT